MPSLMITKIVREITPIKADPDGASIGAMINDQLNAAIQSGADLMEVKLFFDPDSNEWAEYAMLMASREQAYAKPAKAY